MKQKVTGSDNNANMNKDRKILLGLCLVVFILHVWPIGSIYSFRVLDDEFGYWGVAAYLAGYDWSSAISHISYYSYGYSLVLSPLFWIFNDPVTMYRAALVLNGLLLTGIVPFAYSMGKKNFPDFNRYLLMAVSFCVAVYPAFLVQSNIAWAESLLYFVIWLLLWLFDQLDSEAPGWKFGLVGVILPYTYMIHQRSIGVLIAGITVILIMKRFKSINWKQFAAFAVCLIIMLSIHVILKGSIMDNLWLNSARSNVNNYAGLISRISGDLGGDNFFILFKVFCGQLFYLGATTFLVTYLGIWTISETCFSVYAKGKMQNKEEIENNSYMLLFLLLSFWLTFAVGVIFMTAANRADHIIYGRYNEMFVGPLLLFGLIYFFQGKDKRGYRLLTSAVIVIVTGLIAIATINELKLDIYNMICISGLSWYPHFGVTALYRIICVTILCAGIFFGSIKLSNGSNMSIYVITGVFCCFFVYGSYQINMNIINAQNTYNSKKEIVDQLEEKKFGLPVYYFLNQSPTSAQAFFQMLMYDRSLICVTAQDLQTDNNNKVVITGFSANYTRDFYDDFEDEYIGFYSNGRYKLWISKEVADEKNIEDISDYDLGSTIYFDKQNQNYSAFVKAGLSDAEMNFTWSNDKKVSFHLSCPGLASDSVLKTTIAPYLYDGLSAQTAKVLVNGIQVAVWQVDKQREYEAYIPLALVADGSIDLTFEISDPRSPKDAGKSNDSRLLGIRFHEMSINKAP